MKRSILPLAIVAGVLAGAASARAQSPNASTDHKTCHLEQQCHWENFKKICVWVKVCR